MNKTININLGGYFFHIDENAYQKLKRYLDAISRSLSDGPQEKKEIILDIEARISELLSQEITTERQVINGQQIDHIIDIMGQPEDYSEAQEGYTDNGNPKTTTKKLFRDEDDKFLGGVCSGLAYFIGVDNLWIRLIFIILTLAGYGFGVLAYIILWVLVPQAKTTAEKLQMKGEPVNIDNIEKKIRKDFEKIKSADYEQLKKQTKLGLQEILEVLVRVLKTVFKVFSKFLGGVLLFVSVITIIVVIIRAFSHGNSEILNIKGSYLDYPAFFYDSIIPNFILMTCLLLIVIIPMIALFIISLHILFSNIKPLKLAISFTLLGVWLISVFTLIFSRVEYSSATAYEGVKITKQQLIFNQKEPLKIAIKNDNNIFYTKNLRRRNNAQKVLVDGLKAKYSNHIAIDVVKSDNENAYIEIIKESEGREPSNANANANNIKYNFQMFDNQLVLSAFYLSKFENMQRNEMVDIKLAIPKDCIIYFDSSSKRFIDKIDNVDNIYGNYMVNHHFKMIEKGLKCTDCDEKITN